MPELALRSEVDTLACGILDCLHLVILYLHILQYAKVGKVGDMDVSLMYPGGETILSIQVKKMRTDGTSQLITREIVYNKPRIIYH